MASVSYKKVYFTEFYNELASIFESYWVPNILWFPFRIPILFLFSFKRHGAWIYKQMDETFCVTFSAMKSPTAYTKYIAVSSHVVWIMEYVLSLNVRY